MIKLFYLFFCRESKGYLINTNKSWFSLAFFLLCILIFPLTLDRSYVSLDKISISSIWICALFANLISLESLFKEDFENGSLLQYHVSNIPFSVIVTTKVFCHWIFTGIPIILLAPLFLIFLSGSYEDVVALFFSLLLGTPLFSLLGMPFSAMTLCASARAPTLIFLTIPFYLPVIIFGVLSVNSFKNDSFSEYYLLSAILCIGIIFLPYITIKILKENLK